MGSPFIDLAGKKFGKLTVLEFAYRENKASHFKCKCDCGQVSVVNTQNLRKGRISSCGCSKGETITSKKTTHGMSNTRIYRIWRCMLNRCEYPGHDKFKYYGARGITVCERWRIFANFYNDMKEGYEEHLTLERIENNGHYEKSNCKWITQKEQCNNRRPSKIKP